MEAICSSETSVASQQTTRCHIPEDYTLHGDDMFLRNVSWHSTGYTALYQRRQKSSIVSLSSPATFVKHAYLENPVKTTTLYVLITWRLWLDSECAKYYKHIKCVGIIFTLASYLGGARCRISAGTSASLTEDCCGFSQSIQAYTDIVPRLSHECFLPNPLYFIIYLPSYHPTLHDSVVK
jgi:hypothetical protein